MHSFLTLLGARSERKEFLYGAQRVDLEVRKQLGQRALGFGFAQQLLANERLGSSGLGNGHHGGLCKSVFLAPECAGAGFHCRDGGRFKCCSGTDAVAPLHGTALASPPLPATRAGEPLPVAPLPWRARHPHMTWLTLVGEQTVNVPKKRGARSTVRGSTHHPGGRRMVCALVFDALGA